MKGSFRAFLDANVLYPVSLRNLLMRLTLAKLFQALWSSDVHEEWIRAVLRDRPDLSAAQLHSVRAAMDEQAADSLVTGYEFLIPSITLPDPDDRHVLAAAIVAGADVIVTRNLKDFPPESLARYRGRGAASRRGRPPSHRPRPGDGRPICPRPTGPPDQSAGQHERVVGAV